MTAILALLDLVPKTVYAAIVAALLVLCGVQTVRVAVTSASLASAKTEKLQIVTANAQAQAAAQADARSREYQIQDALDRIRKTKDAQIAQLRTDVRRLLDRVPDLPSRPSGDPGAKDASFGAPAAGCAGPVLYQDTWQALAREAERADELRLELIRVYDAWDKTQALINQTPASPAVKK